MIDAKTSKTPIHPGFMKNTDSSNLMKDEKYRKSIGALLYISGNKRSSIAASVSIMSQKVSSPTQYDWIQVKQILSYLKETKLFFFYF